MLQTTDSTARPFSLSRFVEDVRVLVPVAGSVHRVEQLPDGRTNLYLRALDGGRSGDVSVAGPRTRALFKSTAGLVRVVVIQFKPGWSTPFFGAAAHALTDRIVRLEELWGRAGSDLALELLAAKSLPEIVDRLSSVLVHRVDRAFEPASARLARHAVRLLEGHEVRIEGVAHQLGVTTRHLRRAFTENIGIGPKDFARSVRLQRVVRMAASSNDWARIALDAGYYDQAHLIDDFRELVGLTPNAFVKRVKERAPAAE